MEHSGDVAPKSYCMLDFGLLDTRPKHKAVCGPSIKSATK